MKKVVLFCLLGALIVSGLFAQLTATQDITVSLPLVQMVRLLNDVDIALAVSPPATPGGALTGDSDATEYLQYTVLNPAATTQHITVGLASGTVPAGTSLTVAASGGSIGTSAGTVAVGATIELVGSIPSGNTGTGATDGMLLTYTLAITTPSLLVVNTPGVALDVLYTIEDDA